MMATWAAISKRELHPFRKSNRQKPTPVVSYAIVDFGKVSNATRLSAW